MDNKTVCEGKGIFYPTKWLADGCFLYKSYDGRQKLAYWLYDLEPISKEKAKEKTDESAYDFHLFAGEVYFVMYCSNYLAKKIKEDKISLLDAFVKPNNGLQIVEVASDNASSVTRNLSAKDFDDNMPPQGIYLSNS